MSMCALLFSLSHEKIRQKHQLVLKLCLFMWFWPGHAQIRNWSHIPRNVRNLQNLILIVFYIYPAFQNAINHLVTIYGSKFMVKSLEVVSFRVCTLSRNGVVYSKVVYWMLWKVSNWQDFLFLSRFQRIYVYFFQNRTYNNFFY